VTTVLIDPTGTSPQQAAEALGDVARLRRRTRRALGMPWFPLVCFGGLTMLSAPLVAVAGTSALAPLWLVAGAAGMLLTRHHYRRRARQLGLTGRRRRTWAVAVAIAVACLTAGIAGGMTSGEAGGVLAPIVVVAAGYLVLGWLQGSVVAALAVAPGAVLAAALVLAGLAPWIVELTFGAAMAVAGAGLRVAEARS
jgi:hypothetical protein